MINSAVFQGKRARYYTLGCKLNFSETSTFAELLREQGVVDAHEDEAADVCLVNTCSVTEVADQKCRQAISRLARKNPGALIVVTGCYAQLKPERVASLKGVGLVVGNNQKANLLQYLSDVWSAQASSCGTDDWLFAPSCSRGNRTRYFLKVQDGCNYYCTYCTIPMARGRSRNTSIAELVAQVEHAAANDGREIVLTGVNIGDFGRSTGETFFDLVQALDGVAGVERYRISSIEPNLLTDRLIEWCAKESRAFMPHFHIPLQSGSDEVLRLMHRRYDTALFARKVSLIKELMPDAFIGVDVMVGCRGETEQHFEVCFSFLQSLDFSQLHVFPYSERPGTAALTIPHVVDEQEKHRRAQLLLALSEQKTRAFYERFIGEERPVLFERAKRGNLMHGWTDNYIKVELAADPSLDNQIRRVTLGELNRDGSALRVKGLS